MKRFLEITTIIILSIGYTAILQSCKKITIPDVTTTGISDITQTSAKSGGNVTNNGGAEVTARGICWGNTENPTTNSNKTSDDKGNGAFTSSITGLTANSKYYYRAYATNSEGTGYGEEFSFTTSPILLATVTTTEISSITSTTAVSGGNVTDNGGGTITVRGVCWNATGNPTITDNKTTNGIDPGSFSSNLTGLSDGTIYYVCAYATNEAGTAYGEQFSFITPVSDVEHNVYKTVKIGTQVWMAENLKTTKLNDNTDIPNVLDYTEWINTTLPAYCWYDNQSNYKDIYGALYNWYTVNTGKLCPVGWHVPYSEEWETLLEYFGYGEVSGEDISLKLRETGYNHWNVGCAEGNNESGFIALAGGLRYSSEWYQNVNGFNLMLREIWFWSASIDTDGPWGTVPCTFFIFCNSIQNSCNGSFPSGHYIRCVKD